MEYTYPGDNMAPETGEIQIPALVACPMVGGKLVGIGATWVKIDVTNGKVTIAYPAVYSPDGDDELVFREYDIKDVTLSGWPVGT